MIFFIDIVGAAQPPHEPEILTRIIDHEADPRAAKKKAKALLAGVDFIGARSVRVLDSSGRQIFSRPVGRP